MDLADQLDEAASVVGEIRERGRGHRVHHVGIPPLLAEHIAKSGGWVPPLKLSALSRRLMGRCKFEALDAVIERLRAQGFPSAGMEFHDGKPRRIVFEAEASDPRN